LHSERSSLARAEPLRAAPACASAELVMSQLRNSIIQEGNSRAPELAPAVATETTAHGGKVRKRRRKVRPVPAGGVTVAARPSTCTRLSEAIARGDMSTVDVSVGAGHSDGGTTNSEMHELRAALALQKAEISRLASEVSRLGASESVAPPGAPRSARAEPSCTGSETRERSVEFSSQAATVASSSPLAEESSVLAPRRRGFGGAAKSSPNESLIICAVALATEPGRSVLLMLLQLSTPLFLQLVQV
jgi:hypothetical protein